MIDTFAVLQALVVPAGAGTGPQIDLFGAPNIPADLQAFYTGQGFPVVAAIILRSDATHYSYLAVLNGFTGFALGNSVNGAVHEAWFYDGTDPLISNLLLGGLTPTTLALLNPLLYGTSALQLGNQVGFSIGGVSQARGFTAQAIQAPGSAVLGAEAVVLTLPAATYQAGRAYRFDVNAVIFGTSPVGLYQIRRTNLAGAVLWSGFALTNSGVFGFPGDEFGYLSNATGAGINQVLVLTLQPLGGGNIQQFAVGAGRSFTLTDVGAAANWSGAPL